MVEQQKKTYVPRERAFAALFPHAPAYRWRQCVMTLFQPTCRGWKDATALPADMRVTMRESLPWMTVEQFLLLESKKKDTYKAALKLHDGARIETVLMRNARDSWTICVSSQVGCAMGCRFCSTGTMGLVRNLYADEIVDQYRFWTSFLADHPHLPQTVGNIVFMGMGEPLTNYDNVKEAILTLLAHTTLGPTRVVVSTVGIIPQLARLLADPTWPPVRIALSLHSAVAQTRKEIVPTSYENFLTDLTAWAHTYHAAIGTRRRHLTFEYVMLRDVNDTPAHAKALAQLATAIGKVKVNLIPYNFGTAAEFQKSTDETIVVFQNILKKHGIIATRRRTMGDDIAAACGQLVVQTKR